MFASKPVAVVTGATGGMGVHIVRELSRTHTVIAQGRNTTVLQHLAAEFAVQPWQVELSEFAKLADYVAALPRIDVVVHAAAVANRHTIDSADVDTWQQILNTNVLAPAVITRAALPQLRHSNGTVIFIGSGASVRASANSALYTTSKHALKGLADSLRLDEQAQGVRVATVAPGPTDTQMLRGLIDTEHYRSELYIRPESIAQAVRFVVDAPADVQLTDVHVRPRAEIVR